MNENETQTFESWAILELMGHRRIAGLVSETTIGGASYIRIDIPKTAENDGDEEFETTQFYNPSAVYCLTPTTETIARAYANNYVYRPISEYDIRQPQLEEPEYEGAPW